MSVQESSSLHNQGWADLETLGQDRASCAGPSSNRRGMPLGTGRKDKGGQGFLLQALMLMSVQACLNECPGQ